MASLAAGGGGGLPPAQTGRPTFHKVFTYSFLHRLSQCAPIWCVIPSFDHTQEPVQRLHTGAGLIGKR